MHIINRLNIKNKKERTTASKYYIIKKLIRQFLKINSQTLKKIILAIVVLLSFKLRTKL